MYTSIKLKIWVSILSEVRSSQLFCCDSCFSILFMVFTHICCISVETYTVVLSSISFHLISSVGHEGKCKPQKSASTTNLSFVSIFIAEVREVQSQCQNYPLCFCLWGPFSTHLLIWIFSIAMLASNSKTT